MPNHLPRFGQDDSRTDSDRLKDLRKVQRQVRSIITTRENPAFERRLILDVRNRRRQRRRNRDRLIDFDLIPDKYGGETPAAATTSRAKLLIRKRDEASVRRLLVEVYGLSELEVAGELAAEVAAYTGDHDPVEIAHLTSNLRRQGVQTSANYMSALGGSVKSVASPESTDSPAPEFPAAAAAKVQDAPVRVVIIDTGVHGYNRTDGWLHDLDSGVDVESGGNREDLDVFPPANYLDLAAGHGSFCAGIVQQIVPEAEIKVCKVLDSDGFADELTIAEQLVKEVLDGLEAGRHVVVNMSLGEETADDERPVALGAALEIIDEEARERGREALVVAAAGNFGHDRPCYPAAFPTVTAVAALTQGLLPALWSSRGAWVDVCTIGEGVWSTFVEGTESPVTDYRFETFGDNPWALWSGTSFAAPQVAGAIAKIALEDRMTPTEAKRRLLGEADEVPLYGKRVEILRHI
jgi:subtilisin family serine protease